jgi:hypothetical protein
MIIKMSYKRTKSIVKKHTRQLPSGRIIPVKEHTRETKKRVEELDWDYERLETSYIEKHNSYLYEEILDNWKKIADLLDSDLDSPGFDRKDVEHQGLWGEIEGSNVMYWVYFSEGEICTSVFQSGDAITQRDIRTYKTDTLLYEEVENLLLADKKMREENYKDTGFHDWGGTLY